MKKSMIAVLIIGASLTLTACGEPGESPQEREDRNAQLCISNGGSFSSDGYSDGWSCTLPKGK